MAAHDLFCMTDSNETSQVKPADVLREAIARHIRYTLVRREHNLAPSELQIPVSLAVRDQLVDRMLQTEQRYRAVDAKRLYYLSMEFLMGRILGDTLCNLRLTELMRTVLLDIGVSLDQVLDSRVDPSLVIQRDATDVGGGDAVIEIDCRNALRGQHLSHFRPDLRR